MLDEEPLVQSEFSIMHKLNINNDLSIEDNSNFIKSLIGELLKLQRRQPPSPPSKHSTNEYYRYNSSHTVYLVSCMPHASEQAFERYHRNRPYIEAFIDVMNMKSNVSGPTRIATYLAKKHKDVYVAVGQKNGLTITGTMKEVESAAMWCNARLLDSQAKTISKILRYKFGTAVTVPFSHIFHLFHGYTVPKHMVLDHVDGEKWPEQIHVQYQDVAKEVQRGVEELLEEHVASPFNIKRICLIIGGDHGKGAFRLCFRIVINLWGMTKPIHKTKSIAEVYCKKEEGILLEKTIMPWLKEDLEKIHTWSPGWALLLFKDFKGWGRSNLMRITFCPQPNIMRAILKTEGALTQDLAICRNVVCGKYICHLLRQL